KAARSGEPQSSGGSAGRRPAFELTARKFKLWSINMATRRYDRRSRQIAAEETRRRIVRATAELHAEHGGLGTTHAMIAERAGVSLPTVYKYCPTRDDLIPHCTGLVLGEAPVRLDEDVFDGQADLPARLRALVRRVFALHEHLAPWARWSARDAAELPALRAVLD